MADKVKAPVLASTFIVGEEQYFELALDSYTLDYYIEYPSGYFAYMPVHEMREHLKRHFSDDERVEDVLSYATNFRRSVIFPHKGRKGWGLQYRMFPGTEKVIDFGGAGSRDDGFNIFAFNDGFDPSEGTAL
jgi:hypothetical protein